MKLLSTRKLSTMNGVTLLLCAVSVQFVNGRFFNIPETGYQDHSDFLPEAEYHPPVSAPSSDDDDYFVPNPYYPTANKPNAPKPYSPTANKPGVPQPYYPTANKPTAPTPNGYKPYKTPTYFFVKPTPRPSVSAIAVKTI